MGGWFLFEQDSYCLYFWENKNFVKKNSDNQNKIKCVRVVEVYTTKFSHSLFFSQKLEKSLCLLKNCIAVKPKNHWVDNICLKFLDLCFILFLPLSYYNEYAVKQTTLLYLKLPLKPNFMVFLLFWEVFAYFKIILFFNI